MKKRNEVIEFLSVIYQSDSSSINIIINDDIVDFLFLNKFLIPSPIK